MTPTLNNQTSLEYIESLTVTLIRATAEHNKHNGEFFDKSYVEHNPKFYKLDTTGRALFVKILSEILKINFYFGDSYKIEPMQLPNDSKVPSDSDLLGW